MTWALGAHAPYHYSSHYSNSGSVLHFLVRLPPFTQLFLDYQDRNFDIPDRTFHDLATSWRLSSFESTTDVKELLPEFFYNANFLLNGERFDFGQRQNGADVDDVMLPPWCNNDAHLFVRIHRQALESDYVTAHLPAWIDLVFGCKQRGRAAVTAINVFHPSTYFGVNVDDVADDVTRAALQTAIATYGQTPKQLFASPHPQRSSNMGQTLRASPPIPPVLATVEGVQWGEYCGSPACGEPLPRWFISLDPASCNSLHALPSGEVFGLGLNKHLLIKYEPHRRGPVVHGLRRDVIWAGVLSWRHDDVMLRLRNKRDRPDVNFLRMSVDERVTCCACDLDIELLFLGTTSGAIVLHNVAYQSSKVSVLHER